MTDERDEGALFPERAIWLAGYRAALRRVVAGYERLTKVLEELDRYVLLDGFLETIQAAVRGVSSYDHDWDGIPVPWREEAIEEIRGIFEEHVSTMSIADGSLLRDFMDVTPGVVLSAKIEWIRAAKEERVRAPGRAPRSDERLAELVWIWCGASNIADVRGSSNRAEVIAVSGSEDDERPANLRTWKEEDPGHRSIWGPVRGVRFVECEKDIRLDLPAGRTVIYAIDGLDLADNVTKIENWERRDELRARGLAKLDPEERAALGHDG